MTSMDKPLDELVLELPPNLRMEVRDFIEFLLTKHEGRRPRALTLSWRGALKDVPYSSVDLQHKAAEWREP